MGSVVHGVHVTYLASFDKGRLALPWMNPSLVRFRFIPGPQIPEKSRSRSIDNNPATWVPHMVAVFNGGFWLRDVLGDMLEHASPEHRSEALPRSSAVVP